jgi:hypothetical protein
MFKHVLNQLVGDTVREEGNFMDVGAGFGEGKM